MTRKRMRVALLGAGDAGKLFLREIMIYKDRLGYVPVVFLDDNPTLIGTTIENVKVEGPISKIAKISREYQVDLALITMPSVRGDTIRQIVAYCQKAGIRHLIVPPIFTNLQISGLLSPRSVTFEDLFHIRPGKLVDSSEIKQLQSHRVLVTGAAGSIGSEIVTQLASASPEIIVALDISESGLYDLQMDLKRHYPDVRLKIELGDIRNERKLQNIFSMHKPTIVFHAAAYKHVPMLENHPDEAVFTNIGGTLNVIKANQLSGPSKLVVISTDKAVEPSSVMGRTKRIVEILAFCMSTPKNEIVVVRFGNVIESHGSVLPLFRKQVADGGPVTVTHEEVKRFFMTTSEAAQLVIKASLLGTDGRLYVLNMGEPKKIIDLARDIIRLSGMVEGEGIEIIIIGLRPGEKLHEKLFNDWEQKKMMRNSLIYEVTNSIPIACQVILNRIRSLVEQYPDMSFREIDSHLEDIIQSVDSVAGRVTEEQ